ncbi:hypothetical protein J7I94_14770 [Streptomyces sp. ISL-12]|uniref:hypothetical protein n=1 Tax=Streptomyces sp. ISL-12 TaxID=2819177 RepID=UPI001BED29BF|nr:hypothetical protein [Streptomyces sp. ISL-12]MBT2411816.1 hypothetical protein [Streptomyces sp. ISL-12]
MDARGRASENGQVYQAGANMYVTQVEVSRRADDVVQAMAGAVGELVARCAELERQVERARAEGRAAAQAEFAERLRDAELRVIGAQRLMREAEDKRATVEALLIETQRELASHRRASRREQASGSADDPGRLPGDRREEERFTELIERAERELGSLRAELRLVTEEARIQETGPTVVVGETVRTNRPERSSASSAPTPTPKDSEAPETSRRQQKAEGEVPEGKTSGRKAAEKAHTVAVDGGSGSASSPSPAKPRRPPLSTSGRFMALGTFFAAALPLPIAGSAIRTLYAADPGPAVAWALVFDLGVVIAASVVAALVYMGLVIKLDWSSDGALAGCVVHVIAGVALFITGIAVGPDTAPMLDRAGAFVAEYFGPL